MMFFKNRLRSVCPRFPPGSRAPYTPGGFPPGSRAPYTPGGKNGITGCYVRGSFGAALAASVR